MEYGPTTIPIEAFEPPRIDWFSMALAVLARKWMICGAGLFGAVLAGIAAFRMPDVYTASTVILPPPQQRSAFAAILGQISPVAGTGVPGADMLRSPADLYIALLRSRSVADGIVGTLQLKDYYHAKTLTAARNRLAAQTNFTTGKDTLIRISVTDTNPAHAALIANAYVGSLHDLNSRFAATESAQRRAFFEHQVEAEKTELANAEAAMKAMQEKTGLVQVSSQVDAVIRSIAQIRAEITSREALLRGLQSGATDQNPDVVRLRAEIDSLKARLRGLENSPRSGESSGPILAASRVPGAGLDHLRALRQLKYHESLFEVLAKQYESAKIDEAKQAAVVQVVDAAIAPELKSGPARLLLILAGGVSLAILALILVLLREGMSSPERSARARMLWGALWKRRGRECPA
jgi:tyrosine-protein kinase Etk/Wzc